jgi:hypothetical protein
MQRFLKPKLRLLRLKNISLQALGKLLERLCLIP